MAIIKGSIGRMVITEPDGAERELAVGPWTFSPAAGVVRLESFTIRERLRSAWNHVLEIGRYLQKIRGELRGVAHALTGRHIYWTYHFTGTWRREA